MTTVWETEDQRLILVQDDAPEMPYDDGGYPLVRLTKCRHCQGMRAEQIADVSSFRLPDDICEALHHYSSDAWRTGKDARDMWERYLRIWHDVTDIDVIDDVIALNPVEWRAFSGAPRESRVVAHDWRAYANGEVYGAVLQRRETWTNSRGETRDEWETEDSVWGFYGAEWAEEGALEHFPNPADDELVAS